MIDEDIAFYILNYLVNNKWETRAGTIEHIQEEMLRVRNELYDRIQPPINYDRTIQNQEIESRILPNLDSLKNQGLIYFNEENWIITDESGRRTVTTILYCILPKGRAQIKSIELSGRLTTWDSWALEYALQWMPPFGNIDLERIKKIAQEEGHNFNTRNVENLLISYGYCEQIYFDFDDHLYHLRCTDKGRKLRELGSIAEYSKWEKIQKEKKAKKEALKDKVLEINSDSGAIQKGLLKINRWIAGAAITASVYYLYELQIEFKKQHPHFYYSNFPYIFWLEVGLSISAMIGMLIYYNPKESIKNTENSET